MDMQNVSNLQIPEGAVRTIHDKNNRLLWGRVAYDTKYAGDTLQNGTPTPDTPVPVQVVAGEQTVEVTGKNLAETVDNTVSGTGYSITGQDGNIKIETTASNNWFDLCTCTRVAAWVPTDVSSVPDHHLTPADNGTYTLSLPSFRYLVTGSQNSQINIFTNQRRFNVVIPLNTTSFQPYTITLDDGEYIKVIGAWTGANNSSVDWSFSLQLEKGSATSYEPYSGQLYTIDLGSTELCKIGAYQDYVYKSGNGWYVHKATKKVMFNGTEAWDKPQSDNVFRLPGSYSDMVGAAVAGAAISDFFVFWPNSGGILNNLPNGQFGFVGTLANINFRYDTTTTISAWKTWLTNHNVSVYYALATPADTQITDTALISQLNAVHEWMTRYGYSSVVTGNLPIIIDRTNL